MSITVSMRLAVCVMVATGAPVCAGQIFMEPMELALMPGARPQYLFARHAATANDREAMGLLGPVRSVELRFEAESEANAGEMLKQPGSVKFEFDAEGSLVRMSRLGDEDEAAMSAEWEVVTKDVGGLQKVVARNLRPGTGQGWAASTLFEYDEKGALARITTRLPNGGELIRKIERSGPAGGVSAIDESQEGRRERLEFDENGRLKSRLEGEVDGELKRRLAMTWADGGEARCEVVGGPTLFSGVIDGQTAFTRFTLNYGGQSMNCERTAERDQRGNWTTLTTTVRREAREGRPARDWIMARWVRVLEYSEAKPEKAGP